MDFLTTGDCAVDVSTHYSVATVDFVDVVLPVTNLCASDQYDITLDGAPLP